jgi:uracil-DNA glycosylase family 4
MDELRRQYLEAMGIRAWVSRKCGDVEPADTLTPTVSAAEPASQAVISESELPVAPQQVPESSSDSDVSDLDWDALESRVASCRACSELVANRTQTVFGVGNRNADWLVIGEAPGADEDRQGEPFVGKAGQLLNSMLFAIGLKREQVYIANILKCRPPNNRDPRPEETAACGQFLQRQIELIEPKIILVVGRIAAQNLLVTDTPIGKMRGKLYHYGDSGIPVVVTYHPAYLLRSPAEKRKSWEDLKLAASLVSDSDVH